MREPEVSETSMSEKEFLLRSRYVLICFVEDGHIGNAVAVVARRTWTWFLIGGGATSIEVTRGLCQSDREMRTRVYRTLEARRIVVGMHPEVVGVASKLVLGAVEPVVLAKFLRG